jgi:2-methylcitrate dehydratase PrpD
MYLTERFARFATGLANTTLTEPVVHHAKRAVIDWYAALLPGLVEAPAVQLQQMLSDELDRGPARLALGRAASVRAAALIQGSASHAVEFDDIYREAIYHPGAPTISAAWALAQARGTDGITLLRAIVAGYEVSTRIGAALGRAHYRYWHNTGTVGCFGAASACASLLALDAPAHAHALATVGTFAAGLQQAFRMDSMSKPLHAGRAAESGLLAASMAQVGITGSLDILEGEAGMGRAMSDGPDWEAALATLGSRYNITEMTFKNHGCCGHTFAAIDGTLALAQQLAVDPETIRSVRICTYGPALAVAGNPDPVTAAEARFSLPYVIATALRFGSVRLVAFSPERLADPKTRALMRRIELAVDPELDAAFPGQRAARVRLELADGRTAEWLQPTRKGDPDAPLTDAELSAKFLELAAPVIGESAAQARLATLWALESAQRID